MALTLRPGVVSHWLAPLPRRASDRCLPRVAVGKGSGNMEGRARARCRLLCARPEVPPFKPATAAAAVEGPPKQPVDSSRPPSAFPTAVIRAAARCCRRPPFYFFFFTSLFDASTRLRACNVPRPFLHYFIIFLCPADCAAGKEVTICSPSVSMILFCTVIVIRSERKKNENWVGLCDGAYV